MVQSPLRPIEIPMLRRGQIQLRGRLRWKAKRIRVMLRHGSSAMGSMPIVFGNAIPKCGSKLLFNILRVLPAIGPCVDVGLNEIKPFFRGESTSQAWINSQLDALRPGDIRLGYLYASPESISRLTADTWATFMIIRDPRDQVVSEVHYAMDMHKGHAMHDFLHRLPDMSSRLQTMILGVPEGPARRVGVQEHYERFLPWLEQSEVTVVRFEELTRFRRETLALILDRLLERGFRLFCTREEAINLLQQAMKPAKSETFREGKSGGWVDTLSRENIEAFKATSGQLLIRLGYEQDLDW
jgi:hypothetical protein